MRLAALFAVLVVLPCFAFQAARHKKDQSPWSAPVPPILGHGGLVVSVSVNYTYDAEDPSRARPWHQGDVLAYLNTLGAGDGNAFVEQNGKPVNFYLSYTINNDGQDHFTGSLEFSGWSQGHISTFTTEYGYTDTQTMTRELTAQAYSFIRNGWHDLRPGCENGPSVKKRK